MAERPLREHFEALRTKEFSRLDESEHVYLDYTGSGLYSASQLRNHEAYLRDRVFGNPHSESPASMTALVSFESRIGARELEALKRESSDFAR